jgi:hypothetical protein
MEDFEIAAIEVEAERTGICQYEALMTREQAEAQGMLAAESYRFACEVSAVYSMDDQPSYYKMVEEKRGNSARVRLEFAVRDLLASEVKRVLDMPFEQRKQAIALVEKNCGLMASERLAQGVRAEWMRRKSG